ncbi:MAG: YdeI/OmpD-associated family protein [Cyclobacteriaceae bacterium]
MMNSGKTVDEYLEKSGNWQPALRLIREIILRTELHETIKWGAPCYTLDGKHVAGIVGFKEHMAIWFYQGVFLADTEGKLINAQEGVTKAMRQWRFTDIDEIHRDADLIHKYLLEAIENQKQGKEIKPKKKELVIPPELQEVLDKNSGLSDSFEAFSKSKKREFSEFIAEAKRAETKQSRLEKIIPMIASGVGLHDKYR